jgi:hypothetical protein
MSKFDFDSSLERRVAQAEKHRAKVSPPPPREGVRATVDPAQPSLFRDIAAWIAAATSRLGRVVVRSVVDVAQRDDESPLSRQVSRDHETAAVTRSQDTEHEAQLVVLDPHGYEAMTVEQLHIAGRAAMPGAQRLELERVLNRKNQERRKNTNLSAEEHERLWRGSFPEGMH